MILRYGVAVAPGVNQERVLDSRSCKEHLAIFRRLLDMKLYP
jgi:hypothetical protein